MSYIERLRARRTTPHTVWHKLRMSIETEKFDFYLAFEGEEDEEFYSHYVVSVRPQARFRPLVCDGKGGVLALYGEVIEKYGSRRNVFFFIDADHDQYIGLNNNMDGVFVTSGYSLESYALSGDGIKRFLCKAYQLNRIDPIIDLVGDVVDRSLSIFSTRARILMVYLICLRRMNVAFNVDSVHCSDFFTVEHDEVSIKAVSCDAILNKADCPDRVPIDVFRRTLVELVSEPDTKIIRGKMVSQFIIKLCKELSLFLPTKVKMNGKTCTARIDLSKRNFALQFAEVTPIPAELEVFLRSLPFET